MERLFIFTNDDDFIPFCRTIKEYGVNVSLLHLSDTVTRNMSLLREVDSYDVVKFDHLQKMFLPLLKDTADLNKIVAEDLPSALKSEAEPPNMALVDGEIEEDDEESHRDIDKKS